jgi:hypothetical protein
MAKKTAPETFLYKEVNSKEEDLEQEANRLYGDREELIEMLVNSRNHVAAVLNTLDMYLRRYGIGEDL